MGDPIEPARHLRHKPAIDRQRWFWSQSQLQVVAALTLAGAVLVAASAFPRPAVIQDPPPPHPPRFDELQDRLDPNTATVAELAVLPGIGPSKAEAIVAYRATRPAPAFRDVIDLTQVRGIGEITAQKLAPYLHFMGAPTTTASP